MARYDNIGLDGKDAFEKTPSYDSIMKQKAKDTKKALHKQKKEDDAEAADKAMQEEVDKEYEAQKEVEKQALENNGSTVETRDKNKALETQEPAVTAVEDIKTQTKTDKPENTEEFKIDTKIDFTPEQEQALDETDEGQFAKEAVDNKDPSALQNFVDKDGNPVMKGEYTFGEDSVYKPHTYSLTEAAKLQNKGWAGVATIVSKALSAFGLMFGIPIVPINFFKLLGTDEYAKGLNENEKNYAKILNAGKEEANTITRTGNAERESTVKDAETYENMSDEEKNSLAQVNAAKAGQNTQLDVQKQVQDFDKWKTEYAGDLQKTMQEIQNKFQLDLTDKLYRQQVQAIVDKISYMKESGFSNDDIAKAIQSMEGVTTLQRGMGYAKDTVGMVTDIANSAANVMYGKSSATRANAAATNANSNMLRENRLGFSWE